MNTPFYVLCLVFLAIMVALFVLFDRIMTRMERRHEHELERLSNMASYQDIHGGGPAIVIPPAPTPEDRMEQVASEDTIQRGIEQLKEDYARMSLPISDEEARLQVISMLAGTPLEIADLR